MRTLLAPKIAAVIALTAVAPFPSAHAASTKPADLVTIGAAAHPDRLAPVRGTRLARVRDAMRVAESRSAIVKPEEFGTSLPGDASSPSALQLEKLASLAATSRTEPSAAAEGKPRELSTIAPRASGDAPLSVEELARRKRAAAPFDATSPLDVSGHERTTGESPTKPAPISTSGVASGDRRAPARPSALELRRRAAAPITIGKPEKARPTTTSLPRGPELPQASAGKSAPPATQEVPR